MRYVIIGNSAAAVGAIEAIRQHDAENPITVISDETHHVYSRPLVCHLLGELVDEDRMYYRPLDFYEQHQVEPMLGVRATGIDTQAKAVSLAGGGTVSYDRLLLAVGGKPFVPPVEGIDLDGVFTFTKWEDAQKIDRYIKDNDVRSVLIVGGGLIGMKAVKALMARGLRLTVVELADRILSTSFDHTASKLAESILRRAGAEVITNTTVKEIVGKDDGSGRGQAIDHAVLQDGEKVDCDLVIFGIGVRPNLDLILPEPERRTGIKVNRGIVVDAHMRTSVEDVYAAGDCVETYDMILEVERPIAIWPHATRQGHVAGCNMAGVEKTYAGGFPMNSEDIAGVPTIAVGLTDLEGQIPPENRDEYEIIEKYDRAALTYKRLVLHRDRLVGAICVGDIDRAGIYTGLIRDRVDVTPFKEHLLSGSFGLISLPKEYRKHMVVGEGIIV
jgi:NAD(P)H-nitrite reductase large subunit